MVSPEFGAYLDVGAWNLELPWRRALMRHSLAWRALLQTRPNVTWNVEHFTECRVEHCVKYVIKL